MRDYKDKNSRSKDTVIHKIVCIATVEADSAEHARQKILDASNFEYFFGVQFKPFDFKLLEKLGGNQNREPKDPMPELRTKIRKSQGT